jgi:hypothetical protein
MRMECVIVCGFVLTLSAVASAQTQFSGREQCAKPEPEYTVPVSDRPNHAMALAKEKCTWTKGEIGGIRITEEEDVVVSDISGNTASARGYAVPVLANGDKVFVHFQGITTLKDTVPVSFHGTWSFTGGTGKLKGIKGSGTYKGRDNPDGSGTADIEGKYHLPSSE